MPEFYIEPMTDRRVCFKCNKTGKKKLFKCSGCEAITYCSEECQREDWTRHEWNCVPVMVTEIPGKGRGIVAARDIKMGEEIFIDKPVIKLTTNAKGMPVDPGFMASLRDQIAKGCLKIEKFKQYFPLNKKQHVMPTRYSEKYALTKKSSERYAKSALPSMIRLLNDNDKKRNEITKSVSNFVVPMNYGPCVSLSLS